MTITIEEALRQHILGVSAVTDLVEDRIYADEAPVNPTVPFIVVQRVSTANTRAVQRVVAQRVRMQVECWSTKVTDVRALTQALRISFNGRGMIGDLDVIDAIAEDERSDRNSTFELYRQSIDVFFIFKQ